MRRSQWVAVISAAIVFTIVVQLLVIHSRTTEPTHTTVAVLPTATSTIVPSPTPLPTPTLTPIPTSLASDFITQVIARTNMWRAKYAPQCVPLAYNAQLTLSAYRHSQDMAIHGLLSHMGTDGSAPDVRMRAAGYHFSTWAENVGWYFSTPNSVVDAWFNEVPPDDGHRRNILSCTLHEIGVGIYYTATPTGSLNSHYYWTQDFGTQ